MKAPVDLNLTPWVRGPPSAGGLSIRGFGQRHPKSRGRLFATASWDVWMKHVRFVIASRDVVGPGSEHVRQMRVNVMVWPWLKSSVSIRCCAATCRPLLHVSPGNVRSVTVLEGPAVDTCGVRSRKPPLLGACGGSIAHSRQPCRSTNDVNSRSLEPCQTPAMECRGTRGAVVDRRGPWSARQFRSQTSVLDNACPRAHDHVSRRSSTTRTPMLPPEKPEATR